MDDELENMIKLDSTFQGKVSNCSPYNSQSYAVVAAVSSGLAFVSILLILLVIAIIILFKKWKFFSQRLILYLALSAILVNVGIILHRVDYENQTTTFYVKFCEFGGYLDQLSNWMLLISISAIIFYSSCTLFFDKRTEKYEMVYVFFIFIFPFLFTWIPFIKESYGRAGAWCWIRSEDRDCNSFEFGRWLQFSTWFVPLYIIMVVLIILYFFIIVKLYHKKNTIDKTSKLHIKRDLLPLVAYPLIYFLLNIFPFINRTYNSIHDPNLVLWYFAALANPTVGAWMALAFTLDPRTRKRLTVMEITAAARDLCQSKTVVQEYETGSVKENSVQTDSYHSTDAHPYKNYEQCYRLNLSNSTGKQTL